MIRCKWTYDRLEKRVIRKKITSGRMTLIERLTTSCMKTQRKFLVCNYHWNSQGR